MGGGGRLLICRAAPKRETGGRPVRHVAFSPGPRRCRAATDQWWVKQFQGTSVLLTQKRTPPSFLAPENHSVYNLAPNPEIDTNYS